MDPRPAFDPSRPGHPEASWSRAIAPLPTRAAAPRDLVVVAPHPDDETLGAGGLMATAAAAGRAVTVVVVTDGEAGAATPTPDLGRRRRKELREALRALGVTAPRVVFLAYPDGDVAPHAADLEQMLERIITPTDLLVGPWLRDGHPDHEATATACRRVAQRRAVEFMEYPVWAWHHSTPEALFANDAVRIPLEASRRAAKVRAIQCYRSQREGGTEAILPDHLMPYFDRAEEVFVR